MTIETGAIDHGAEAAVAGLDGRRNVETRKMNEREAKGG
jgi:hypothetical protein